MKRTLFFLSLAAIFVGFFWIVVVKTAALTPDFSDLRSSVSVPIRLADGTVSSRLVGPRAKGWVPLYEISNQLIFAVLASEDTSFFSHKGIDFHELQQAIKKDIKEKRWARGASTLTQQLIKNVYLSREKTLIRKFKEMVWARELEKKFSKPQILGFYLNLVEWGPGVYGIGQASRHYFRLSPSQLTAKQSAFLAMLLPAPTKYHAYFAKKELSGWATRRVNQILKTMNQLGYIDGAEVEAALNETLWGTGQSAPGENYEEEKDEESLEQLIPQEEDDDTVLPSEI
ncbi:MAG: transglycosylase domain-containing protein [Deltaproteobacteria bacterium]|nr:transglycosylase domain-containing protein [Deltaproteobacteria bacterium]